MATVTVAGRSRDGEKNREMERKTESFDGTKNTRNKELTETSVPVDFKTSVAALLDLPPCRNSLHLQRLPAIES